MPNGEYVGMYTAPVEPWPHQEVAARRIIDNYPASYLMCDEMGLGKTLEAGLVFRSLYLSKRAKRILIAAPASLTRQWQREMASKFFLSFDRVSASPAPFRESIFPVEVRNTIGTLYEPNLVIVSTGLMARKEYRELITQADRFDIALVDEAHYACRSTSYKGARGFPDFNQLYLTIAGHLRSNCRSLLLATATPMQLDPVEVSDLIRLTNRVGAFQYDPSLMLAYYRLVNAASKGVMLKHDEWDLIHKIVISIEQLDPKLWAYLNDVVIDQFSRIPIEMWLKLGTVPDLINRKALVRLLFAAAPISRVMQRHTRELLNIYRKNDKLNANLANRIVLPTPTIVFTKQESNVDGLLREYCEGLKSRFLANGLNESGQVALGFYLSFLRLRFASSLLALKLTLQRRKAKVKAILFYHLNAENNQNDIDELKELLIDDSDDDAEAIGVMLHNRTAKDLKWEGEQLNILLNELNNIEDDSEKFSTLLKALRIRREGQRIKQTVIFTRFLDTLHDIQYRLKARFPNLLIGIYSGEGGSYYDKDKNVMINVERDIIKHRFMQGHIDILLCTDAAAEGLNLQIADMLINYDLPWNPIKLEQRIGRIDRIGQKYKEIFILNLCFADSSEQFVYEQLLNRLAQANLVVGSQQFSILLVTTEEFQALADGSMSETEVEQHAMERVKKQNENNRLIEMPAQEIFNIYGRLIKTYREQSLPLTLSDIWKVLTQSEFLKQLGCEVSQCNRFMTLKGIDVIEDGVAITVDRALFDEGLPNDKILYFATLGEPVFERLLTFILGQSKGLQYKIIEIEHEGIFATAIAYIDKIGRNHVITSLKQALKIDNIADKFDEHATQRTVAHLESYCSAQSRNILKMEGIERNNQKQAEAQVLLNNQIVRSLMYSKMKTSKLDDNASVFLKALEEQFDGRETTVRISDVPHDLKNKLSASLIQPRFLVQGDGHIDTPIFIVRTALESLARRIDGSRASKRQTASSVIEAIKKIPTEIY